MASPARISAFRRGAGEPGVPQSFLLEYKAPDAAYLAFIAFYAICFAVTWFIYIRESPGKLEGV